MIIWFVSEGSFLFLFPHTLIGPSSIFLSLFVPTRIKWPFLLTKLEVFGTFYV